MTEQVNDAANAPAQPRDFAREALGSWRVSYLPGSWLVLSGPSSLVMLDAQPGQAGEFVNDLWEDVVGAASVSALVGRLAARGLDRIADLGVLFIENGAMRTLVRGGVRVLDADTGAVVVDGTGVITWRESRLFTGRVRVDVGQGATGGLELPLVIGAAQCSSLLVDLNGLPPVAAEEQPAQAAPGDQGGQWHPASAAEGAAPAFGNGHHRDWTGAPGQPEPVEGRIPAGAATKQFGAVDGGDPASYGRPESSTGQVPVRDEPADAAPMNWMAQQPRDDSFMYEETEVLGDGRPAPQAEPATGAAWDDRSGSSAGGYGSDEYTNYSSGQDVPADRTLGQETVGPGGSDASRADWPTPALARVVTISGLSQPLNGPLLIGRSPQLPDGTAAETMRVPSPHHDISRSHVYLEPQNGQILVTDMNSTNGTIIYMPNANPLRLENGQSILVPVGTTLDLGDGEQVNLAVPPG